MLRSSVLLQVQGDYKRASDFMEKAAIISEKNYGPDHQITVDYYFDLAGILQDLGDYEGAQILMKKVIKSNEKNFGTEHLNTARSYFCLAVVLLDLKQYPEAKTLLSKALSISRAKLNADDSFIQTIIAHLHEIEKYQSS